MKIVNESVIKLRTEVTVYTTEFKRINVGEGVSNRSVQTISISNFFRNKSKPKEMEVVHDKLINKLRSPLQTTLFSLRRSKVSGGIVFYTIEKAYIESQIQIHQPVCQNLR